MKKRLFYLGFSLLCCVSILACKQKTEGKDKTGPEYTSAYVCPMHCEGSGSAEAGVCPVCTMDYVANVNAKKD